MQVLAKLLLSGYYGFGNLGDEAILASTVEALRRRTPETEIWVLSANPEETTLSYGIRAFNRMSPIDLLRAVGGTDLVVFGGGSLLQDATSFRSLLYYIGIIYLAKVLGKPLVVYANGIGPLGSRASRCLTRSALLTAREITLRDPESEAVLREIGLPTEGKVSVTADPAFLLSPAPCGKVADIMAREGLGGQGDIVWLALRGGKDVRFYRAVADAVAFMRKEGLCPALLVMQERDLGASEAVQKNLEARGEKPVPLVKNVRPAEALGLLQKGLFSFGMRLHTLILSAHAEIPFLGVEIDPKIGAFCRMVENPCIPDPGTGPAPDLVSGFRKFLENRSTYSSAVKKHVPVLRQKAEENIDMVVRTLYSIV
ncbi:MAG TPA: polysaccharide pyruvyl transferase CsaB [Firmicutes bacterium]|nr:polysaccharide pyruvyl transferase CsaB [Candidatus Fermentithermobacillaceae bacterium]